MTSRRQPPNGVWLIATRLDGAHDQSATSAPVGGAFRTRRGLPNCTICRARCVRHFPDGAAGTRAQLPNHMFLLTGSARYLAVPHSKDPRWVAKPYVFTCGMRSVSCDTLQQDTAPGSPISFFDAPDAPGILLSWKIILKKKQ